MSENHKSEPDNDKALNQWIRGAAPGVRPPDDYRRTLRLILLSKIISERTKRLPFSALGIAAVAIFLLFLTTGKEIGSGDFQLKKHGTTDSGKTTFYSKFTGQGFDGTNTPKETLEQIHQQIEAGQEILQSVEGWTINGITFWSADYVYSINGKLEVWSREPNFPISTLQQRHHEFWECCEKELKEMIDNGRANYLGTEDIIVDGLSVRIDRWAVFFPDWGNVIYSSGGPLISQ